MSKIKLIKLLLSIIFKRFAVFCSLIKRGLKCSKESLQHVGGFYPVHKLVEFMLMQNLLSLHRIFGACEAVDLPTSRAQIFTRARRADFFGVFSAANASEIDFLKVLPFSFPVPVVGLSAKALALSFAFTAENIKSLPLALRARDKIQIDL